MIGGTHIPTDCACLTHGASCDSCPTPTLPLNDCLERLIVGNDQTSPCA